MQIFILLLLVLVFPAHAETLTGRVIGVTDGDTLKVLDAKRVVHKIRLAGIDAPEKKQEFGQKSKANLSALTHNQKATLQCQKEDRHRTKVCVVSVDGVDVGLEQLKSGLAWWYRKDANKQSLHDRLNYGEAEFNARKQRISLWQSDQPIPPWQWQEKNL